MIFDAISRLLDYGVKRNIITIEDQIFVRNRILDALKLLSWEDSALEAGDMSIDEILAPIVDYAVENQIIADSQGSRDLFDTKIMGAITPRPSEVIKLRIR